MAQSKTHKRYHQEILQQDLLGDWTIIRSWGGRSSHQDHHTLNKKVNSYQQGKLEMNRDKRYRRWLPDHDF